MAGRLLLFAAQLTAARRPNFTVLPRVERRGDSRFIVIPEAAGYGITERQFRD